MRTLFSHRLPTELSDETGPSEEASPEDIHEKIRRGVIRLLNDAGYPEVTFSIAKHQGDAHLACAFTASYHFQNIPRLESNLVYETFTKCVRTAVTAIASEILGPREISDQNWSTSILDAPQ